MAHTSETSDGQPDWGDEVLPNVYMIRRAGSSASAANRTGLSILSNTLAHDGSTIDYHKVHERITDRKALVGKLRESNQYMVDYLVTEKKRRARRLRQIEREDAARREGAQVPPSKEVDEAEEDESDLPPITPEDDDGVIESSILENELIIKDATAELKILTEMVAIHHCMKADAGTDIELERMAMELLKTHDSTTLMQDEEDEEGYDEEVEEEGEEDDNAPFEDDVTSMQQATATQATGRFAL